MRPSTPDTPELVSIDENQLKVGIMLHFMEYDGEKWTLDELVQALQEAGLLKGFVHKIVWDLFMNQTGILVQGNPLGAEIMIPEDFAPEQVYKDAYEEVRKEAVSTWNKILPTYYRQLCRNQER